MDDQALTPQAPSLEMQEDEIQTDALVEDKQIAAPYFHKSWAKVEEYLNQQIAACGDIGSVKPDLPAIEYKVEALSNARCAAELKGILEWIKNAVTATESGGE